MHFTINESRFKNSFESTKKGFQHNKGAILKLFPFATDKAGLPDSDKDFVSFYGITGHFHRNCLNLTQKGILSKQELINAILARVHIEKDNQELSNIVNELIFNKRELTSDKKENILLFSSQVLPYLTLLSDNSKLKNLQSYISHLFIDDEVKEIIKSANNAEVNTNILYSLVIDQLKSIVRSDAEVIIEDGHYQGTIVKEIREQFKVDLKSLVQNNKFYTDKISTLIKYYYFLYIVRLSGTLNNLFSENLRLTPFHFSLEWEKLSKSRLAVDYGWKKLEAQVEPMFAHANCLELLNTINLSKQSKDSLPFVYTDILQMVKQMDEESEKSFTHVVNEISNCYKEKTAPKFEHIKWDEFELQYESPSDDIYKAYHSLSLIHKLFSMIKYLFDNSKNKNSAYQDYSTWFKEFVKHNYYKSRGPLGGTLKIDKDTLLLFTELSILAHNKNKILTSYLWEEFEKRGILLDNQSKREVISFFQKINILEKKSDSGDAQYVKRLYK